jgi:hypothetical protein
VVAGDGDTLVDLIYCPKGLPMGDDVFARGEELSVLGMEIRVMALEDVMATRPAVRSRTEPGDAPHRSGTTVRVVTPHRSPATQGG